MGEIVRDRLLDNSLRIFMLKRFLVATGIQVSKTSS